MTTHNAQLPFIDLTTVRQDAAEMAMNATEAVAERLERGRIERREIITETTLVVRSSTGRAPERSAPR